MASQSKHPIEAILPSLQGQPMRVWLSLLAIVCIPHSAALPDSELLKQHCGQCHSGEESEGEFQVTDLGSLPNRENLEHWLESLDRVRAGEMPPSDDSRLSPNERQQIVDYLQRQLQEFDRTKAPVAASSRPRRMNNREFAASIADVLLIEDVGTHLPVANLLGDARFHGFDTHGETLGFSKFHLEQYIRSVRKIVDATLLAGEQPKAQRYKITPQQIFSETTSQNTKRPERRGKAGGFDFLDPKQLAYLRPFKEVNESGWYKIRLRVIGLDRGLYDAEETGIHDGDPIQLRVLMGDRVRDFQLPDETVHEIKLKEWLAAGTRLRLQYPTDGLRLLGNGNFKFQNRITAHYFKKYEPDRYAELVPTFASARNGRRREPDDWHNWVDYWRGPRPRLLGAEIEGPLYDHWPTQRQVALIGESPAIEDAESILSRIAERAWRRPVRSGELDDILKLVEKAHASQGIIAALKEGIVSILVSPQFLLLNLEELSPPQAFASKYSYFLQGTIPSIELRRRAEAGDFASHAALVTDLHKRFKDGGADSFLSAFPYAWMELNDINFMAPDPDKFRHYHRKRVSEDMIDEVLHLFEHAIDENVEVPELLLGNYSFVNADLAQTYGLEDVPQDSRFRKYAFKDGRRGGLLGTGAFLTSTADSLFTSPIHRAIFVMENFLGIHPSPPPGDIEIQEPDVRQAKTIKEILSAHRSDKNCQTCHQLIDPFGYAFENYGPDGSWRDSYVVDEELAGSEKSGAAVKRRKVKVKRIPIDASAEFLNAASYRDIEGYREILNTSTNKQRMVRCFVTKLLTYANGVEPDKASFGEIDRIMRVSAANDYHIVETIAAVIDSPLFRDAE